MSEEQPSHHEPGGSKGAVSLLGNFLAIAVPVLMILMLAATGVAFVISNKEEPPEAVPVDSGIDPEVMKLGKISFALCGACHGMDGKGLKVGPSLMAPTMVGSEIILGDPDKMALVILKGIKKENVDFIGIMAPLALALDDEKLAAVMTYVRNSFGNSASLVTPEMAKKARERFVDLTDPTGVSRTKLDEILAAHK